MQSTPANLPTRKHLPHKPPVSVSQYARGASYFITICADRNHYATQTNINPLIQNNNAIQLLFALDHYRATNALYPRIAVIMPDHIHFIATFSESADMTQLIRSWKRWTSRQTGIIWQDGFFDHRLRSDSEISDKMNYISQNPVRKNLCASAADWPFRFLWP